MCWPHKYSSPHGCAPADHPIASAPPPPTPPPGRPWGITWWSLCYLFNAVLGHLWAGLCQERVFLQIASSCSCLPQHPPQSNSWLTFLSIPRHTECCWLYPSNFVSFFQEKEIDRNWFENVKPYQRPTVTSKTRYFLDGVMFDFTRTLFKLTVQGVKPQIQPIDILWGPIRKEIGIA